mmetsp:Transcript_10166/g.25884  ORF Transcript_10166/g.25884 Transcript_10166/m.25884 type:complete len:276 (+) Transcript_10166:2329-3156(+)
MSLKGVPAIIASVAWSSTNENVASSSPVEMLESPSEARTYVSLSMKALAKFGNRLSSRSSAGAKAAGQPAMSCAAQSAGTAWGASGGRRARGSSLSVASTALRGSTAAQRSHTTLVLPWSYANSRMLPTASFRRGAESLVERRSVCITASSHIGMSACGPSYAPLSHFTEGLPPCALTSRPARKVHRCSYTSESPRRSLCSTFSHTSTARSHSLWLARSCRRGCSPPGCTTSKVTTPWRTFSPPGRALLPTLVAPDGAAIARSDSYRDSGLLRLA